MSEQENLLASVRALSQYFVGDATMIESLERVTELARDTVAAADQVGITLVVGGRPGTYVFTDPEIPEVDQRQYETGDGPCLEAYDTGGPVILPDTRSSEAYRAFGSAAAAHGILSVLSMPLETPQGRIGAINFYAGRPEAFGAAEMELARGFAQQASFLLANAQAYWDARTMAENLAEAMRTRATIEQAKGIIMATTGCGEHEAFARLTQQSQHENVKVRDLAEEIVRRAQRS